MEDCCYCNAHNPEASEMCPICAVVEELTTVFPSDTFSPSTEHAHYAWCTTLSANRLIGIIERLMATDKINGQNIVSVRELTPDLIIFEESY